MSHPLTQAEFARLQGWSRSHVTGLKQAGRLVMVETPHGARVDVAASLARIAATADARREDVAARHAENRAPEVPQAGAGAAVPLAAESRADAISRKAAADADVAEMQRDLLRGRLVEVAEVRRAGADLGVWLRSTLENRTAQLAAEIGAAKEPDRVHALLVEAFEQLLNDYAARVGQAIASTVEAGAE